MISQKESTSLPSAEQLLAARGKQWHQDGNALLSLEALREWLNRSGLVLYAPRAQQLGAPTPSFVEATLGKAEAAPSITETEAARGLLAHLIAEGAAVPLNLLGATGGMGSDVPDFVVSAAVFSYIFTLRGNKAWKQMPATSGAVKVSPLALAAYEMLSAKVTLSAYDLTTQLGKEVTEAAVLRALTELWSQLRVIPVPQVDGSATLWELCSARFTKQIKSGANAGQPSALSALISLYLGQAISATEDEIESFLSPLSPRSRTRDVLHALLSARQLETLVIDGKTLLHVAGELPSFAAVNPAEAEEPASEEVEAEGGPRIAKFTPRPGSKLGTGLRAKPAFGSRPLSGRPSFGSKPAYGKSAAGQSTFGKPGGERERRPFRKEGKPSSERRPSFDKPWQEGRPARPQAESPALSAEAAPGSSKPASFTPRSFTPRSSGGSRPTPRMPRAPFVGGEGRPPRREFTPREGGGEGARGAGPRKTFSKPGTFGRKREGFAGKPAFGSGDSRPPRLEAGPRDERPQGVGAKRAGSYTPRPGGFGARPAFGPKGAPPPAGSEGASEGATPRKIFRKFDAPRGGKPFARKPGERGASGAQSSTSPFSDRSARPFSDRPARQSANRPPSDRAASGRPAGSDRPRPSGRPAFGAKPEGSAGKKPFGKPSGFARGGGPFAKFADGKKPFRKPGTGKPSPANSSGPKRAESVGSAPVRRKRPGQE